MEYPMSVRIFAVEMLVDDVRDVLIFRPAFNKPIRVRLRIHKISGARENLFYDHFAAGRVALATLATLRYLARVVLAHVNEALAGLVAAAYYHSIY